MTGSTPARREVARRWPAEWEPHRATWLSWPHNKETWPSGLAVVEDAFSEIVRAILPGEDVEILIGDAASAERVRGLLLGAGIGPIERVRFHEVPTNDAWIRDHGGVFVHASSGAASTASSQDESTVIDFVFDAWGGKYPPWDLDAEVAAAMAAVRGVHCEKSAYVLEAGSVEGDGEGTILTTESCLLNPNRLRAGQSRRREEMEALLESTLGARQILWLGEGIRGDDTDGHVDDLTRFVSPARVVTAVERDSRDENFAALAENRRRLTRMTDALGRSLDVIDLPMPRRIVSGGDRLPASYANFYVSNASVLVPVFSVDADREALGIFEGLFPDRAIAPIPARDLVEGLGAVHCVTQQEPEPPRRAS